MTNVDQSTKSPSGILAIWNNCVPGREAVYEHWYQSEHLIERLAVPGFRRGRRYEAITGERRYFTYYETDTPDTLRSVHYLERVDNPSPLTERIMPGIFIDMSRTVCRRVAVRGNMRGCFAVTLTSTQPVPQAALAGCLELTSDQTAVARAEVWSAVESPQDGPSHEEGLRGGDEKIVSCLFVEALREEHCHALRCKLADLVPANTSQIGTYRLVCELTSP